MDAALEVMLMLKNNWSLTGDLDAPPVTFTTRLYDEGINFPQIVVSPISQSYSPPIDLGNRDATYLDLEGLSFNIYVRPPQDSNKSLGWAKNAIYKIYVEAERILKSGSVLTQDDDGIEKFIVISGWKRNDNLIKRPVLLILNGHLNIIKYKKGV